MDKLKIFVKKYDFIFVFLVFNALLIIPTFGMKLYLYDELWNFSNVYKMANGYKIYQECNVIVTPLFFYIGTFIFKIIGANFFGFRIYSILINSFLFTSIYTLFKSANINKKRSFIYSLIVLIILNESVFWGANYNNLAIAFSIFGITLFIKNKNAFWQGIIIFFVFMSKQNIGVYYAIGITIARLFKQKNIKKTIIETSISGVVACGLVALFLSYLHLTGNLYSFIDLTVMGLSEFAVQNIYATIANIGSIVFQVTIIICALVVTINKKIPLSDENRDSLKSLICFSIPILMVEYPIFNLAHLALANMLILITYLVLLEEMMFKDFLTKKQKNIISIILLMAIFLAISVSKVIGYIFVNFETDRNSPYYGTKIDNETRDSMNIVCDYIKRNNEDDKRTVIVSYKANLYLNILKQSNNKFDLPFYGNMGKDGEDGLISEIDEMKNTYILISRDKQLIQESEKIINYIKNNFELVGKIDEFDIYKSHDM